MGHSGCLMMQYVRLLARPGSATTPPFPKGRGSLWLAAAERAALCIFEGGILLRRLLPTKEVATWAKDRVRQSRHGSCTAAQHLLV